MRSIKQIHNAVAAPIADLITYRALPTRTVDQIDPFLFLNHHGPQVYPANNRGLPFGPHPHRGMETVTFILEGDIMHKDSSGNESVIKAGGVQWMTAGSGLIHAEISSSEFKKHGGPLEILQLWVNLPARNKMIKPFYKGLQRAEIPFINMDDGKVSVNLISGEWNKMKPAFETITDIQINTIHFKPSGKLALSIPAERNIFFYVIKGSLVANDKEVKALQLVEFYNNAENLVLEAKEDSILLFGHAKPFQETVIAQGPFVMNTEEEIHQAYEDYRQGKFGDWS